MPHRGPQRIKAGAMRSGAQSVERVISRDPNCFNRVGTKPPSCEGFGHVAIEEGGADGLQGLNTGHAAIRPHVQKKHAALEMPSGARPKWRRPLHRENQRSDLRGGQLLSAWGRCRKHLLPDADWYPSRRVARSNMRTDGRCLPCKQALRRRHGQDDSK